MSNNSARVEWNQGKEDTKCRGRGESTKGNIGETLEQTLNKLSGNEKVSEGRHAKERLIETIISSILGERSARDKLQQYTKEANNHIEAEQNVQNAYVNIQVEHQWSIRVTSI